MTSKESLFQQILAENEKKRKGMYMKGQLFIKILQKKEQYGENETGQLIGFGIVHGVTIRMPKITGYSIKIEELLKPKQWKRQVARTFAMERLTEKELNRSVEEQVNQLKKLIEQDAISSVTVTIIDEIVEYSDGTLDITFDNHILKHIAHDSETNEVFVVVD